MNLEDKKRIYFLGVCGTAMASLAAMLKSKGYFVYGSDFGIYPPMSDFLREQKIDVYNGFGVSNLSPAPDLVIVGNVISRGNVEIEEILDRHIPYLSLPDALREFIIRGKKSIVVTGTHGKTTTTSLLSWIFSVASRDPGFMIGGIPLNFNRGFQLGQGDEFIIEGDEYDSAFFDKAAKFLRYLPDVGIINTVEFDHADIYNSLDEIKTAFKRFVNLIPRSGLLCVCADSQNAMEVCEKALCPVRTFGLHKGADWQAQNINYNPDGLFFDVYKTSALWGNVNIKQAGDHNIRNALAAIAVSDFFEINKSDIQTALSTFSGVKRRMELKASVNGIDIYDDFAHHPTAVKESLTAMRKLFPNRRIWALYEPRSATSRRNIFQQEFVETFESADVILVAPVHRPDKAPQGQLFSSEKLAQDLKQKGKTSFHLNVDEMVEYLKSKLQKDDIVITFSNGPFESIHQKLLKRL